MDKFAINGRQIAAARALLGMFQRELAKEASISVPTLKRMEKSAGPVGGIANNVKAVRQALEAAGITFLGYEDGSRGVLLKPASAPAETEVFNPESPI
jgi:predicted transcriptional regulator